MSDAKPTFKEWINDFANEDSIAGDLASDISRDKCWPDDNTFEKCLNHLKFHNTPDIGIEVFKDLWERYSTI